MFSYVLSVAHFVGWSCFAFVTPGSASPSPGASILSACFAGWLNGFFQPTHSVAANGGRDFVRSKRLINYSSQSHRAHEGGTEILKLALQIGVVLGVVAIGTGLSACSRTRPITVFGRDLVATNSTSSERSRRHGADPALQGAM